MFEIVYHYQEEIEKGVYDKDNPKTKTVKVGAAYEDVSLEVLAGKIIAQLARRNILITDVEIYEYTKKRLSYKETDTGILIKNKKFNFEDGAIISSSVETLEDAEEEISPETLKRLLSKINEEKNNSSNEEKPTPALTQEQIYQRPLREETFHPDSEFLLQESRKRGYKFTVGKKYPIFKERTSGHIFLYVVKDDEGNYQSLASNHFTPLDETVEVVQEKPSLDESNDVDLWGSMKGVVEGGSLNLR